MRLPNEIWDVILKKIQQINLDDIRRIDPNYDERTTAEQIASIGRFDILKIMLTDPYIDPSINYNIIIYSIFDFSHDFGIYNASTFTYEKSVYLTENNVSQTEIFNILINDTRVSSTLNFSDLFEDIIDAKADLEILDYLLNDERVVVTNNACIKAIKHGKFDIIKLLLTSQRVDCTFNNYQLFEMTAYDETLDVLDLLMNIPNIDVQLAKDAIKRGENDYTFIGNCKSRHEDRAYTTYVNFDQNPDMTIEFMEEKLDALEKEHEDWSDHESLNNEQRIVGKILRKLKTINL